MIILLTGADTYRSQRRFELLRQAFRDKHDASGMGTSILDGQTATPEQLRAATTTQGFFSSKRFVGLNRWQATGQISAETINEVLQPFIESKDVIVVIRQETAGPASGRKPRKTKAATTAKIKSSTIETFDHLEAADLQRWIHSEAKRRGGQVDEAASRELAVRVGTDSWRLNNELDKLLSYAGQRPATVADVQLLVPAPEVTDMFALTDAVGHKRKALALQLLERELSAGTHPLAIISQLANHLATLRAVQREQGRGTPAALAERLSLHPFVVKKAAEQSRNFDAKTLATWHHRLVSIDFALKQSSLDAASLLDVLIVSG